jgi:CRP-like cAMP-binding protein
MAAPAQNQLSARELQALVADNPIFADFNAAQFETMLSIVEGIRRVEAGVFLLREGDRADTLFIIQTGRFEVVKREEQGEQLHRLATLGPGMSIGEIALLDRGPRSASVRALVGGTVLVIPIRAFERVTAADAQMKIALGHQLARRLRTINEVAVCSLRDRLHEALIRAEMGRLMCRLLIGTCLYMYALGVTIWLQQYLPSTTPISIVILLAFATSLFINIKTSSFPANAYGFNTRNWQVAVKEALLFSLPVAGLIVLAKAIMIHSIPALADEPLFDLYRSKHVSLPVAGLLLLAYTVFAPVQEVIARAVQSALMLYLRGRFRVVLAILVSTMLFSATHLHTSLALALEVFPLGLFWGWLYLRNPTLIGVSLSHILLGQFAFFAVGIPD